MRYSKRPRVLAPGRGVLPRLGDPPRVPARLICPITWSQAGQENAMSRRRHLVMLSWLLVCNLPSSATEPVFIGLDGEFGYAGSTSAEAIRMGLEIAIEEINQAGGVLQGRK